MKLDTLFSNNYSKIHSTLSFLMFGSWLEICYPITFTFCHRILTVVFLQRIYIT